MKHSLAIRKQKHCRIVFLHLTLLYFASCVHWNNKLIPLKTVANLLINLKKFKFKGLKT